MTHTECWVQMLAQLHQFWDSYRQVETTSLRFCSNYLLLWCKNRAGPHFARSNSVHAPKTHWKILNRTGFVVNTTRTAVMAVSHTPRLWTAMHHMIMSANKMYTRSRPRGFMVPDLQALLKVNYYSATHIYNLVTDNAMQGSVTQAAAVTPVIAA